MEIEVLSFIENQSENIKFLSDNNLMQFDQWIDNFLKDKIHSLKICFTGLRSQSLEWKFNEDCELCLKYKNKLKNTIEFCYKKGFRTFISGMALGFDMYATEIVLALKEKDKNVKLVCFIPCTNQDLKWTGEYKKRYHEIINKADEIHYISDKNYFNGCYQIRNKKMVDCADLVIAGYSKTNRGRGTKTTVEYALKQNQPVLVVEV